MLHEEDSLSCSDDQVHLSAELKIATYLGVAAGLLIAELGHVQGMEVGKVQGTKSP